MNKERLKYLYEGRKKQKLSSAELLEWDALIHDPKLAEDLKAVLEPEWFDYSEGELAVLDTEKAEAIYRNIVAVPQEGMKTSRIWPRMIGVAAAVAAIVFGVWFYTSRHPEGSAATRDLLNYANDIAPGKNTATLTLANGDVINLSDMKTGVVVGNELRYNDNTAVISTEGRDLLNSTNKRSLPYGRDDTETSSAQAVQMLTAATPRGGTYQITLPDGTKVWLNADSKISFPSQFIGEERKILLLYGEVYFEVTKDKRHPFIVDAGRQKIAVLGTHFNVNAYKNEEAMKTTLLEGRVEVEDSGVRQVLTPGSQAYSGSDGLRIVSVNANAIVDWKDGDFVFKEEPLESILRRVARWYNIDVVYKDLVNERFTGTVSRNKKISEVLYMLERAKGVHFSIDGKKVTVSK